LPTDPTSFALELRNVITQPLHKVVIATSSCQASYEQIAARATLETLIRLAAAEELVPNGAVVARSRTLMIRPSRIATLNWRFRRGCQAVVAADGALV
jgi:predicted protein tyrosine phosphatase